jgi:hypothetical protein
MKVMKVANIGSFVFERTLFQAEYPIAFICRSLTNSSNLFFYEVESNQDFEKWMTAPISSKNIYSIMTNQLSLRGFFIRSEPNECGYISHLFADDSYSYKPCKEFEKCDLPGEDSFVGNSGFDKEQFNLFVEKYADDNCSYLSLRINPYALDRSMPVSSLCSVLQNCASFYAISTGKKPNTLLSTFDVGSLIVTLTSHEPDPIGTGDLSTSETFSSLARVLSSGDIDSVSDTFVGKTKLIPPAKKLSNFFKNTGSGIEIYSKIEGSVPSASLIKPETLSSLSRSFSNFIITSDTEKDIEGVLVGYDTVERTFHMSSPEYGDIKGKLDNRFKVTPRFVSGKILAKVAILQTKSKDGSNIKAQYRLLEIK